MLWNFFLFETKLILRNRKNLFLGLFLLLFFWLFFLYYSQTEPESLEDQKRQEANVIDSIFHSFPLTQEDMPEGQAIYQNYVEQSSLINFQIYYLGLDDASEDYIENGLRLNELRVEALELGNSGVPDYLLKTEEEIVEENALLTHIQEHQLPLQPDVFVASHFLVVALSIMSGFLFYSVVLLSGSEILVYEQRHRSVMNGFPLGFMKRIHAKISIHFIYIFTFLIVGLFAGGLYAAKESGVGDFSYPVLIYQNGGFETISTIRYFQYVLLAAALTTLMVLYLSVLLNMIFKNAYASVLIGLGLFFLPDLVMAMGVETTLLYTIKYVDFSSVLSGHSAGESGNTKLDYWHAMLGLLGLIILLISMIYAKLKFSFFPKAPALLNKEDSNA
ncbi:hypothetical protein QGM71_15310 [Virgibacillus sp. C22-A2]|uniref:ABC transporter permease n=1 Tax=Virgibacillus tibetensis TaxID=3042313 RepID=A0ABU6KI52_9BACI|nr:hypothetical protein [Virgibacillus sp. C22-A2]